MKLLAPGLILLSLAACGRPAVNPPTEPAAPVTASGPAFKPGPTAAPPPTAPGQGLLMPGAGPPNFMGRWAANSAGCAGTAGEQGPVVITTTRFESEGKACALLGITQQADGYRAGLACEASGRVTRESVRMVVNGDTMRLVWLTRGGLAVPLVRCPTPGSPLPAPDAPSASRPG